MSFPAPSAFPDGKIVSDSLPADLWTFLQTSCDFPAEILRISCGGLLQGQADGKGDPVVRAGSPDRPAVEGNDFLGYGQAKARAACPGGAGAVQAEELRIQNARKLSEEAATKLLLPMVMLLVVVMVMIMVPAFSNAGI